MSRLPGPLLATCVGLVACGPRGPVEHPIDPDKPVERVVMEEMVIVADPSGEGCALEAYDATLLFDNAFASFEDGRWEEALDGYLCVLAEFPDSSLVPAATFNLALTHEKLGDVERAAALYDTLVEEFPGSTVVVDAMFRRAYCLEDLDDADGALEQYEEILGLPDLTSPDTLEAMARMGHVLMVAGRLDEAEETLRLAVSFFVERSVEERFENTFYAAQAQFDIGEVARLRFEKVAFGTDEAEIRQQLEVKLGHMIEARDAYVQAIKIGNYFWATAGGYSVGQLFATMHEHVMTAPLPPELNTQELVQMYNEMLEERVRPLLESAISVWEKTLLMAERVGIGGPWVERTEQALDEARLALAQVLIEEEGEIVVGGEGADPHDEPSGEAGDGDTETDP